MALPGCGPNPRDAELPCGYTDDMNPDDEICYCYHVSLRKLVNYSRRVRPNPPSRMTECLSAGTGCGWCIPFLVKIAESPDEFELGKMTTEEYAERRSEYRSSGEPKNEFTKDDTD